MYHLLSIFKYNVESGMNGFLFIKKKDDLPTVTDMIGNDQKK